jgi:hypothetical protein
VGEIADATGQALNFPLIADPDRKGRTFDR